MKKSWKISVLMKMRKNYYNRSKLSKCQINDNQTMILGFVCFCICSILLIKMWNLHQLTDILSMVIMLIAILIIKKTVTVKMNFKKEKVIFESKNSVKAYKITNGLLDKLFIFWFIDLIIMLFIIIFRNSGSIYTVANLSMIFFLVIISISLMQISFQVSFLKEGFITGDYYVQYSEIDSIEIVGEKFGIEGTLYCCEISDKNEVIGFDKFLVDEYLYLKKMITNTDE